MGEGRCDGEANGAQKNSDTRKKNGIDSVFVHSHFFRGRWSPSPADEADSKLHPATTNKSVRMSPVGSHELAGRAFHITPEAAKLVPWHEGDEMSNKDEFISIYLKSAENWQKKGNQPRLVDSLSSALLNYLSVAVCEYDNIESARVWMGEQDVPLLLSRLWTETERLIADIDAERVPGSVLGGNYTHLTVVHLGWVLREFELGECFAKCAVRSGVMEMSTVFWQEYAKAMMALVEGVEYRIGTSLPTSGQEKYWLNYLHLIESATQRADMGIALSRIDDAFTVRNTDHSINDDYYEIEGSGDQPVHWDFRRDSLIEYIRFRQ